MDTGGQVIGEFDCDKCRHQGTDECNECSVSGGENECTCFINPPCGFCTNNKFEEKEQV
jgi:hypothetical protein